MKEWIIFDFLYSAFRFLIISPSDTVEASKSFHKLVYCVSLQSTAYSLQSTVMSQRQHRHPCDDFTIKVLRCHKKYGKQGEECVREELAQKKCFAQMLCRREAARFYHDERSTSTPMSTFRCVKVTLELAILALIPLIRICHKVPYHQ